VRTIGTVHSAVPVDTRQECRTVLLNWDNPPPSRASGRFTGSAVIELTAEQLRDQRAALVERVPMSWERFEELAEAYALDTEERNIYDTIKAIDFLLSREQED
jgi:hypothetical protein